MSSKSKVNGLNSIQHTAGIFSDMTVDGPEIGTLVVIVDRAKNLPNRRSIGKQDPFCAIRLGKEAKKTETDRRGGQTPRWDQELRYTVHDSPDYYQLKVSIFNDDKKTDLIGETWVDLKEIIVPGGGQNDIWHNLGCKGKYAGEIRLEITYYDTRPQEKAAAKVKQAGTNSVKEEESGRESLRGPRQPKEPVRRRPLPSDPITGAPAASPITIPDHIQTPPRGYPPSPKVSVAVGSTPPRGYREPPAVSDHIQNQTPPRGYQSLPAAPDHAPTPPRSYQNPPSAIPDHVHTPTRSHQSPSYIPNQSPLQSVEYNTPPPHFSLSQEHESRSQNGSGPARSFIAATPTAQPIHNDRYEIYDPTARTDFTPSRTSQGYHYPRESSDIDHQSSYGSRYDTQPQEYGSPPSPGGPPPPPPAHRSRNGSTQASPNSSMIPHGSYGFPSGNRSPSNYGTPTHEPHRRSIPAYSQSNSYQAYSPEREQFRNSDHGNYQNTPPHHQYDSAYAANYGSMQPTVEDAPPSPGGGNFSQPRHPRSRTSSYDDRRYNDSASPAPLNLASRGGSAASGRNSASSAPAPSHQYSSSSIDYTSASNSQLSYRERSRDRSHTDASMSSRTSYNSMPRQEQRPRGLSQGPSSAYSDYGIPPVPATLVAGIDPAIAQEISERIYDEKRSGANNSSRGRPQYQDPNSYEHNGRKLLGYHDTPGEQFVPVAANYDDRQSRYATGAVAPVKPRPISPSVRVPRKSVSPAPRPSEDQRRLSGVPFGPDSYNALNPSISGPGSMTSISAPYDHKAADQEAKIITHDGREIDPSDHIPESNYAPLLEQKNPKPKPSDSDHIYRPTSNGQAMSATGRRPLRQAARPQSMSSMTPVYMSGAGSEQNAPATNRNRLQKKATRTSTQPAPLSSPLAPISPYQDNSYAPRTLPRASTIDFASRENQKPLYDHSPSYRSTHAAPPIPAKVPEGPPYQGGYQGSSDTWALQEELKNIDLGTGRARRRGY